MIKSLLSQVEWGKICRRERKLLFAMDYRNTKKTEQTTESGEMKTELLRSRKKPRRLEFKLLYLLESAAVILVRIHGKMTDVCIDVRFD